MASVHVEVSTKEDAENALAGLWFLVELHELVTPNLLIEFDGISQTTFLVTIDEPAPSARILRAWSNVYGGLYLESMQPRQWVSLSTLEPQDNVADVAEIRFAIGPIAGLDYDGITLGSC
jgi:hypothetical protein